MINILVITFLVVAIVIGFITLSMCDVIKDTDIRNEAIRQKMLKNKRMANAEPECSRCLICGKKFADGGSFRLYNGKWFCFDCYKWVKQLKNETDFNKACKEFNVEVKAGEK